MEVSFIVHIINRTQVIIQRSASLVVSLSAEPDSIRTQRHVGSVGGMATCPASRWTDGRFRLLLTSPWAYLGLIPTPPLSSACLNPVSEGPGPWAAQPPWAIAKAVFCPPLLCDLSVLRRA